MVQRCDGYSRVFGLVLPASLDNRPLPPLSPTDFTVDRGHRTEEALKAIQHQVAKFLKKAEAQVEANIRSYTDQQQAALTALQARTRRDRQTIMRLLANVQTALDLEEDPANMLEMDGAARSIVGGGGGGGLSFEDDLLEEAEEVEEEETEEPNTALPPLVSIQSRVASQPMGMNPMQGITGGVRGLRLSSSVAVPRARPQGSVRVAQSLDAEGLFDMEGMLDPPPVMSPRPQYHSDEEDTDDSNHDEGIHIPVRDLAQSVPVNIPMWGGNPRPPLVQDREPVAIERPADTSEMAASIKALARSVHTTSVDLFGELPRPARMHF